MNLKGNLDGNLDGKRRPIAVLYRLYGLYYP